MGDNRFSCTGAGVQNERFGIEASRILDACRDRDCFEDVRIFLTSFGEEVVANASNIRTRCAKLIGAYVGVDAVPFNRGFYRVTVRYYVKVECEACLCMGKSQSFCGIAVLEKDVILYGGEGRVVSYSSSPATALMISNAPSASLITPANLSFLYKLIVSALTVSVKAGPIESVKLAMILLARFS